MNLLETVLDYQMLMIAVVRALEHVREHRWDEVRTSMISMFRSLATPTLAAE